MSEALKLASDALAVYRLTKLVMEDRITLEFREAYWKRFSPSTKMGFLLTCPWCISIWAAIVVIGARKLFPEAGDILSKILATSAVTSIAYQKGL